MLTSSWCEPGLIRVHDSPSDSTSKTGSPTPNGLLCGLTLSASMKSALAGAHSGKLRATARKAVLAIDFSIFSSIGRVADGGCPASRAPRRLPFDAASSRKVHAGFGRLGRNGPHAPDRFSDRDCPEVRLSLHSFRNLRPSGTRGGNPLRQYLPARPGDGRLPRLRAHARRDRKLGKHERCRAPRRHGGAAGPHGVPREGERLIA